MSKINSPAGFKNLVRQVFAEKGWTIPAFVEYKTSQRDRWYRTVRTTIWQSETLSFYLEYRLGEVSCRMERGHLPTLDRGIGPDDLLRMAIALQIAAEVIERYYFRLNLVKEKNLVPEQISRAD